MAQQLVKKIGGDAPPRSSLNLPTLTGKNNGFPFLDIFGYLKNTHKNPKFGKVRQVPTREFPTKFPDWDLSHSSKFGIFVGYPKMGIRYFFLSLRPLIVTEPNRDLT